MNTKSNNSNISKKKSLSRALALAMTLIVAATATACTTQSDSSAATSSTAATSEAVTAEASSADSSVMALYDEDLGNIRVSNMRIPSDVYVSNATYTYSGKVFLTVQKSASETAFAVMNDDGTDYREIWAGSIDHVEGANGTRYMPFQDNTRVLLGDYILECSPSIDECESAELIPLEYPESIMNDEMTTNHWSEIIIAPDNKHIAWTMLRNDIGAADAIGELVREDDRYVLENVKIISTLNNFVSDPDNEGYLLVNPMYGGEVKQFIDGGAGISMAGALDYGTARPTWQSLITADIAPISSALGYEETAMLSLDDGVAILMSTRGSEDTNFAFLDLMPRPNSIYVTQDIIRFVYQYSVSGVRSGTVDGNIGPVLIDVEKSMTDPDYAGIQLNDPSGKWVYISPISWNDDGTKAMWIERSTHASPHSPSSVRFRIVELLDRAPSEPTAVHEIDLDAIPYALELSELENFVEKDISGMIAGQASGHINYVLENGVPSIEYVNYSDDGLTVFDGTERVYRQGSNAVYECNVTSTGENPGVMDIVLTFTMRGGLVFDEGSDGLPMSRGYVEYDGKRFDVADMASKQNSTGDAGGTGAMNLTAVPSGYAFLVNGAAVEFDAYSIMEYEFVQLRDIAYTLNGTEKQFDVSVDGGAFSLLPGQSYTPTGSEMGPKGTEDKIASFSYVSISVEGEPVEFPAFNIDGKYYFRLDDVAQALDFSITLDSTAKTVTINTSEPYSEP